MFKQVFIPYISLVVICTLLFQGCASSGGDQVQQQQGFAGAPDEFGNNLNENFGAEGGNEFGQQEDQLNTFDEGLDNFGDDEAINSDTGNEFDNFGSNNLGNDFANEGESVNSFADQGNANQFAFNQGTGGSNDQFFNNQDFQGNNPLFGSQGNGSLQGSSDPLFANQGSLPNDQGEGINSLLPSTNQFNNQGAIDTGINSVVDQSASNPLQPISTSGIPSDGAATPPPSAVSIDATGLVKYVMTNGSALHQQKNGSVLKTLEQGEHPLVFEEGEWSRTSDGYYIPTPTLTRDPIPRRKLKAIWTY